MRDPQQINLRYESAFLSEFLLANLLSPAAVGTLTPQVSQQEYSRLFERDGAGISSSTEYFSRGDWVQSAVQYGNFGDFSYSAEAAYRSANGEQPNSKFEQTTLTLKLKQQLTPQDSVYLQTSYYDAHSGDVTPYYNPASSIRGFDAKEKQDPLLLLGYHHEWSPGHHTLLLLGRVPDRVSVRNPQLNTLLLDRSVDGSISDVLPVILDQRYRSELELYTAEFQQIATHTSGTLILGGRFQTGSIDTDGFQSDPRFLATNVSLNFPVNRDNVSSDFYRASAYAYELWRVHSSLQLIGGVSYDILRYPRNFRSAPVASKETTTGRVSPKAGFIYTPLTNTIVRGAYSRGLGGVSFDQSFRIEPSQVAGFNQAYRSIIPESVAGANAAAIFESAGVSLEQKFGTGTYLGLSAEVLWSEVGRGFGVFDLDEFFAVSAAQAREKLRYRERTLTATFNQLIGDGLSLGAVYRLSQAQLQDDFSNIPGSADFTPSQDVEALLQEMRLFAIYNHPSGFFARWESVWLDQTNDGYDPALADENFWQHNMYIGYRFARRRAEIRIGVLNLTDEDYRLNPLNLTARLARERTFYCALQFNF